MADWRLRMPPENAHVATNGDTARLGGARHVTVGALHVPKFVSCFGRDADRVEL